MAYSYSISIPVHFEGNDTVSRAVVIPLILPYKHRNLLGNHRLFRLSPTKEESHCETNLFLLLGPLRVIAPEDNEVELSRCDCYNLLDQNYFIKNNDLPLLSNVVSCERLTRY